MALTPAFGGSRASHSNAPCMLHRRTKVPAGVLLRLSSTLPLVWSAVTLSPTGRTCRHAMLPLRKSSAASTLDSVAIIARRCVFAEWKIAWAARPRFWRYQSMLSAWSSNMAAVGCRRSSTKETVHMDRSAILLRGLFRNASNGEKGAYGAEIGKSRAYIPVAKWGIRARTFGRFLQMRGGVKKHRF
eukprot:scaffold71283_cov90-Phaeocystis_antarctica.AAC.3